MNTNGPTETIKINATIQTSHKFHFLRLIGVRLCIYWDAGFDAVDGRDGSRLGQCLHFRDRLTWKSRRVELHLGWCDAPSVLGTDLHPPLSTDLDKLSERPLLIRVGVRPECDWLPRLGNTSCIRYDLNS